MDDTALVTAGCRHDASGLLRIMGCPPISITPVRLQPPSPLPPDVVGRGVPSSQYDWPVEQTQTTNNALVAATHVGPSLLRNTDKVKDATVCLHA